MERVVVCIKQSNQIERIKGGGVTSVAGKGMRASGELSQNQH